MLLFWKQVIIVFKVKLVKSFSSLVSFHELVFLLGVECTDPKIFIPGLLSVQLISLSSAAYILLLLHWLTFLSVQHTSSLYCAGETFQCNRQYTAFRDSRTSEVWVWVHIEATTGTLSTLCWPIFWRVRDIQGFIRPEWGQKVRLSLK